jgi:hypothetical protein
MPDRHGAHDGLPELLFQKARRRVADLRVHQDVDVGPPDRLDIRRAGAKRRHQVHVYAERGQQDPDLDQIIPVTEAQCRRPQDIGERPPPSIGVRTISRRASPRTSA